MSHYTDRANAAQAAIKTYAELSRCSMDTEALRDLITDLGHWADWNDIPFETEVVHALAT